MTQEAFIKELKYKRYSYEIVWNKIVVTHKGGVYLNSLTSLPSGVVFKNAGNVYLKLLKTLPPGVEFKNERDVYLDSLKTLPSDVEFKNLGVIYLNSLTSIPSGVVFKNVGRYIDLDSLTGGWFSAWNGNIEGIESKRLLNKMIELGLFDKGR